jgi:hypothetical protein
MAYETAAIKERPVWASIPVEERRKMIKAADGLVVQKMHDIMCLMNSDLIKLSKGFASAFTDKEGHAAEFLSKYYVAFMQKEVIYRKAFEATYNDPKSEEAQRKYFKSVEELFNTLQMAMTSYVAKRTDLWFRYVDAVAEPLNWATTVSIVMIPFTWGASAIEAGIAKGSWWAVRKVSRKVLEPIVKKEVAKKLRSELLKSVYKNMMYPVAGSMTAMVGKGVLAPAVIGPKIARETAEKSKFLNALVNLPPEAKDRKDIEDALGKSGALPEALVPVYRLAIAKNMKEMGEINPISHLSWKMMAIYSLFALPFLPAKVKKPIARAVSMAMRRKTILISTVPVVLSDSDNK